MREFTRCLLLAAHVTFCGAQRLDPTAAALQRAAPGGEEQRAAASVSMHAAFWALLAEMERCVVQEPILGCHALLFAWRC